MDETLRDRPLAQPARPEARRLADRDDLTVTGLEPEAPLLGLVLVDLELAGPVTHLAVRRISTYRRVKSESLVWHPEWAKPELTPFTCPKVLSAGSVSVRQSGLAGARTCKGSPSSLDLSRQPITGRRRRTNTVTRGAAPGTVMTAAVPLCPRLTCHTPRPRATAAMMNPKINPRRSSCQARSSRKAACRCSSTLRSCCLVISGPTASKHAARCSGGSFAHCIAMSRPVGPCPALWLLPALTAATPRPVHWDAHFDLTHLPEEARESATYGPTGRRAPPRRAGSPGPQQDAPARFPHIARYRMSAQAAGPALRVPALVHASSQLSVYLGPPYAAHPSRLPLGRRRQGAPPTGRPGETPPVR